MNSNMLLSPWIKVSGIGYEYYRRINLNDELTTDYKEASLIVLIIKSFVVNKNNQSQFYCSIRKNRYGRILAETLFSSIEEAKHFVDEILIQDGYRFLTKERFEKLKVIRERIN